MGGWNSTEWTSATSDGNWRVRRETASSLSCASARWTPTDVALTVAAFFIHWQIGLAFLALKLWQQASGQPGSAVSFAKAKWEGLVATTRSTIGATPFSVHVGPRSSGNKAFDTWRETELTRIDAERAKLRTAERDFAAYRDELLHAKDREDFDRFMQARNSQ